MMCRDHKGRIVKDHWRPFPGGKLARRMYRKNNRASTSVWARRRAAGGPGGDALGTGNQR